MADHEAAKRIANDFKDSEPPLSLTVISRAYLELLELANGTRTHADDCWCDDCKALRKALEENDG